jgi:hypothetical protein
LPRFCVVAEDRRYRSAIGKRRLWLAGEDGQYTDDVVAELGHVVLQEVAG